MGDLARACGLLALCAIVSLAGGPARAVGTDANDRVWVERFQPAATDDIEGLPQSVPGGFTSAVVSWNAVTPGGSWLVVSLRARVEGSWTRWYVMGLWSADRSTGRRHSVAQQADDQAKVETDTLTLRSPADQFQVQVRMQGASSGAAPSVSLLAVATSLGVPPGARADIEKFAWGTDLHVPERTQRVPTSPDAVGGGGDSWCSPASLSMVMAYWAKDAGRPEWDVDVPRAAEGTYDPVYDGTGNWPFNVAFASELGLAGYVRQFSKLSDLEQLVARAVPVIASLSAKPGELDGAPYKKTDGHLLVVRGFTNTGDVIVNDPYSTPGEIRRIYKRDQFAHVWLDGSGGTVYLIAPATTIWEITN
jgi:Peptidase_C39 like family